MVGCDTSLVFLRSQFSTVLGFFYYVTVPNLKFVCIFRLQGYFLGPCSQFFNKIIYFVKVSIWTFFYFLRHSSYFLVFITRVSHRSQFQCGYFLGYRCDPTDTVAH